MATTTDSVRIEVDTLRINKLVSELSMKNALKGLKGGLRKSAGIIRRQAQKNLVSRIPSANTPGTNGYLGKRNYNPLKSEINISLYRNGTGARVDLLDKRRYGRRGYLLKFLELGTKARSFAGANRGSINASYFFRDAVNQSKGEAEQSLNANIIEAIQKVIDKNK